MVSANGHMAFHADGLSAMARAHTLRRLWGARIWKSLKRAEKTCACTATESGFASCPCDSSTPHPPPQSPSNLEWGKSISCTKGLRTNANI